MSRAGREGGRAEEHVPDAGQDPVPEPGWVDRVVAEEFPELRLLAVEIPIMPGPSPDAIRERLRLLSNRFHGARAVTMRQDPIPAAYRIFYRHIGLDPDATRTPLEEAAVQRLLHGGFRSENLVDDALLLGLIETGIPLWMVDSERVDGPLGIRPAAIAERLGRSESAKLLPEGRLVIADAEGPVAVLFGDLAEGHGVTDATRTATLFSVQVSGVPAIHVEEALWTCVSVLESG